MIRRKTCHCTQEEAWGVAAVRKKLEAPLKGLVAMRFDVGYAMTVAFSFRKNDIAWVDLCHPSLEYPEIPSAPELAGYCCADHGARIRLHPSANDWNRYDGDLSSRKKPSVSLFDWLIKFPIITSVELVYDKDYWLNHRVYRNLFLNKKQIQLEIPVLDDESADCDDEDYIPNLLQKTWIDKDGCLNVEFHAHDFEEAGKGREPSSEAPS